MVLELYAFLFAALLQSHMHVCTHACIWLYTCMHTDTRPPSLGTYDRRCMHPRKTDVLLCIHLLIPQRGGIAEVLGRDVVLSSMCFTYFTWSQSSGFRKGSKVTISTDWGLWAERLVNLNTSHDPCTLGRV